MDKAGPLLATLHQIMETMSDKEKAEKEDKQ
jgi:hypothetical protein